MTDHDHDPTTVSRSAEGADTAMAQVDALARGAGVEVVAVDTAAGHHEVAEVFRSVWGSAPNQGPVRPGTMRAAQHVGAYVVGLHVVTGPRAGDMVAASFAFHGADGQLHSHITGVVTEWQGRGLGQIAKLHQRAWCLQRGVDRVTWTFDPLVRRNAHFNLVTLGAEFTEYLPSFYGPLPDGINAGDDTDRAFIVWNLGAASVHAAVASACGGNASGRSRPAGEHLDAAAGPSVPPILVDRGGEPVHLTAPAGATQVAVAIPADIERVRREDPACGARWRRAVRTAMVARLADGWRIAEFTVDGTYLLEAP